MVDLRRIDGNVEALWHGSGLLHRFILLLAADPFACPSLRGLVTPVQFSYDRQTVISPEGFSYGPSILEVVPNAATADGGQTGTLISYGFGTGTTVTVGGKSAPITAVYAHPIVTPYPYPVDAVQFTIPAGTAGTAVDVTVTTASGTTSASGAFHYTAAAESYPLSASLQAGIYDPKRDLFYFTDTAQIQVLSRSAGKWLVPIPLPGVVGTTRLLAIAESPDGSRMAVSDFGGNAIYLLDPDNPAAAQRFSMPLIQFSQTDWRRPDLPSPTTGRSTLKQMMRLRRPHSTNSIHQPAL